ncbi:MAG: hypothetical protein U9O20_02910 [Patescibacteria group bacterium]|nr:hypothetical protein [Patescibacteria group bacterium]
MSKPIMLIVLILVVILGYYYLVKPRLEVKTEYEKCYEKCAIPVVGSSPEHCERFCGGKHELRVEEKE